MRVEITRSGGFGGITRSWTLEVSRDEAEQRWLPLAEADTTTTAGGGGAGAAADAPGSVPGQQRDRFTYRITIGSTAVSVCESRLGAPWRELIDRARAAAPDDAGHGEP